MTKRFDKLGPVLHKVGYDVFPGINKTKKPSIDEWPTVAIDTATVSQWAGNGYARCSVAIRCNTVKAIDVDITDEVAAKRVAIYIEQELNFSKKTLRRFGAVVFFCHLVEEIE